ncbi:ChrR family anti-sigma-E factor [Kineobactrum salinum]|uniref:Anti-sigma factor n=1 Tax=Kineobactrum salinum TaxID=2708301 RepID=A0A6C0U1H3_9GAMM|nr:ChrR family anti-sigma-E factor [Kineobactrum salinum]QIB65399.1 anti-sigma factor [Kineobactrum salinum]
MIRHHPSADRLTAFSAGSLPLSQALCIRVHLEHCRQCRDEVERMNQIGALLLNYLPPAPVSDSLKAQVLASIDAGEVQEAPAAGAGTAPPAVNSSDLPRCLQAWIPEGFDKLGWKRVSPSIQAVKLCNDVNGSKVELLKIRRGGKVAPHNHTGEEITLVLEGSFSDSQGVYGKGDIIFRNRDDKHHRPIASQDADCICLTAVEAPIQFTGFFGRLFNPFIRRSHYAC